MFLYNLVFQFNLLANPFNKQRNPCPFFHFVKWQNNERVVSTHCGSTEHRLAPGFQLTTNWSQTVKTSESFTNRRLVKYVGLVYDHKLQRWPRGTWSRTQHKWPVSQLSKIQSARKNICARHAKGEKESQTKNQGLLPTNSTPHPSWRSARSRIGTFWQNHVPFSSVSLFFSGEETGKTRQPKPSL